MRCYERVSTLTDSICRILTADAEHYKKQWMQNILQQTMDAEYYDRQWMQNIITDSGCRLLQQAADAEYYNRQQMQNIITCRIL